MFFFLLLTAISISLQVHYVYAIDDYNFVAAGDWGCTSNTDATVNNMISKNPERVLGLGDYSYAPTGTCWFNKISPIDSITKITIGNHDDDSSEGFSGYMSHFGLSQTYYSFNHQNTHLLVMDSDRNVYSSGSPQYNFVVNDLQSASQNPSIDWIIVYLHKFMYTSPSEESAFTSLRNTYHPIFQQYGVDLVLQGHQHNYQRTFPIKYNTNNPSDPTKTSTSMNDYTDTEGQMFAIVGTGGQDFDPLSGKATFVVSQQASKFGMLDIKITSGGSKLEGKYYTNDGSLFDQFSITKENSPPVANGQAVTVSKDTVKSITLSATDPNNDPLTYSIITPPSHGTISAGTGTDRTYTPVTGYSGPDSFTFRANDGTTDSNIATVSITVQEPGQGGGYNYAPSFAATGSTYNDTPNSSSLQLSQFSLAAWFKTSTNFGSDAFIVNKGGVGSDSAGQNMNYGIWMTSAEQIKAGFETSSGADQFVTSTSSYNNGQWHNAVVTNDGSTLRLYVDGIEVATKSTGGASPESSGTKPVRVGANSRVTPPGNFFNGNIDEVRVWNDDLTAQQVSNAFAGSFNTVGQILYLPFGSNSPPVANNQALNINKNTQQTITLIATDPNNNPLTYTVVQQPTHGSLTGIAPNLNYQPATSYLGPDSFTFKANDGTTDSNIATVSITVQNGPPVANNQIISVNKNTQKAITLTATDPNNDPLTYAVVTPPENGTLSGTAPNLIYDPNTDHVGTDSFTFKANDSTTDSNIATIGITIQEPPIANNQIISVNKNTQKAITLTATDPNNDPLTYAVVTSPENGTLSGTAPNLTYNPTLNHVGTDSFTFKANDSTTDSNIATVDITVQNGPPVANNQIISVNKNTQKAITLTATDPNNDPLTYSIAAQPLHGTLLPSTPGGPARTYTPATDYVGTDSFTFKANDGTTDSNIATVSITVQNTGQSGGYNYAPSFAATGSTFNDTPDSVSLRLTQFTVAAWFKTSTNFASESFIVNKGGIGSDSAGQNQNYQISMTSTEQIKVGFETSTGADQFLTSPLSYSDGQWHYAVVTNDGSTLILYIDGAAVTSKSVAGSSPENTGTKPVRVGANSRVTPPGNFFTGEVDEVRIWNDDLTAQQVADAFAGISFTTASQKLYLDFGTSSSTNYQYGPSLTLTGP